jgi:hypothetical protein
MELMFSMAIGSVILIVAATMLRSSGDGYERLGGNVASEREARALITQIASDLATANFHKDTLVEKSASTWTVDKLGFLSLQPAQAQTDAGRIGDLCAVNYYIKDLPMGGKTVRCLMRGFRESKDVFAALRAPASSPPAVAELFKPQVAVDEPIAFGVVSFEARPRARDAAGRWIDWVKNDTTGPEALDIKLVVARRELVGKLKTSSDWDGGGNANLIGSPSLVSRNKNLEVYSTSLRFGNRPSI